MEFTRAKIQFNFVSLRLFVFFSFLRRTVLADASVLFGSGRLGYTDETIELLIKKFYV